MPGRGEELEQRVRAFVEVCRAKGLKATHQRMEIVRELAGSQEHPDAETIYRRVRRRVPAVSRDTVYRTLSTLESHGLVCRADTLGGPARFDPNLERHHHFICTACGAIRDFRSPAFDRLPIPQAVRAFGDVTSARVEVRGVCAECLARRAGGE